MSKRLTVGILTFHEAYSYGATMQCLGLQLFLRKKNIDAVVIDYSMEAYKEYRDKHKVKTVIRRAFRMLNNPVGTVRLVRAKKNGKAAFVQASIDERNKAFEAFRKQYYVITPRRYNTVSELKNSPPVCDAYVCGSDQIWNPNFCDFDANYFLEFANEDLRIAYAPSFGVKEIPLFKRSELKRRLMGITYLSIREESGAGIIRNVSGKDAEIVIDPTFLVSADEWKGIANQSQIELPEAYILTYFIGVDNYIEEAMKKIELLFPKYEIINLVFDQTSYGPADFLQLIANAKYVLTNSFHGCAFCINMNIPFSIIKTLKDYAPGAAFGRMENLLNSLKLERRIVDHLEGLTEESAFLDYTEANMLKDKLVKKSADFLLNSIAKVVHVSTDEKVKHE